MRGRGGGLGRAGAGLARDPSPDCVSFQGAAQPVPAADEPGGRRPNRSGPRLRPPRLRRCPCPPAGAARPVPGSGAAAHGPWGHGAVACARSWCRCAHWAWATAPTSWCVSASAAALAAVRAPRTTSAWPACWAPGPYGSPRAPCQLASPAAGPRTMRPSPSWTSTAPGGQWTDFQPLPAAAWAEDLLQGFADLRIFLPERSQGPQPKMDTTGLSSASDGHQPWADGGMTDQQPGFSPCEPEPYSTRDLGYEDLRTHFSQTLAQTRPQTEDSSEEPSSV